MVYRDNPDRLGKENDRIRRYDSVSDACSKRCQIPHVIRQRRSCNIGKKNDHLFIGRPAIGAILILNRVHNHNIPIPIK